ncbi:SpoIIE family protein phosphatase [Streptomyces sp. NPDC090445]|uniref:SpoIIE family protein phosphatase n=1 Tax=Streptomyces sp. NPDC090445 TaxID=3365963 RepID=UPI00381F2FFB
MGGFLRRLRRLPGARSLAGQVFVLQVVIVVLLVAAAVTALVVQSRADGEREARKQSLAAAEAFAQSVGIGEALAGANPSAVLQPRAEEARKRAGVSFIVVMSPEGIRYTHPNPAQIGKRFIGTIGPAAEGRVVSETFAGTLGPSVRSVVPVTGADGKVIGLVAAGVTVETVSEVVQRQLPLAISVGFGALVVGAGGAALVSRRLLRQTLGLGPVEITRLYEHHDAVLHAVREGVVIVGGDGRLVLANDEACRLLDLAPGMEGRAVGGLGLDPEIARVLESRLEVSDEVVAAGERLLAVNQRSAEGSGRVAITVATLRDTTELRVLSDRADVAKGRLQLLWEAGGRVGTTLDVVRTCEELALFAVPRFADFVTVDLLDWVMEGEEPQGVGGWMRRVAREGVRDGAPVYPLGAQIRFVSSTPQASGLGSGRGVLESDLDVLSGWQEQDARRAAEIVAFGIHSMMAVPLQARGVTMGVVTVWRSEDPAPFEEDDLFVAEELVARAAVSIDNARRYTREHATAVTLQRSLLPRALPDQSALDVAYRYLPAQAGVGGDWFDVIALPGARVALVVGDVVGHGLHAAATMGRLRTAVLNFSAMDLPPDEVLWNLDELVTAMDREEAADGASAQISGATCLYVTYDPVTRRCVMARAGHPEPAVVGVDGRVRFAEVPGGPPLGLASLPFETAEFELPEGSQLVLYTNGLIEDRNRDISHGLARLAQVLGRANRTPEETCQAVLEAVLPDRQHDDIALIVARTRELARDRVADWDVPSDPSEVGRVRASAVRQLTRWGLEDEVFPAELVLSELVTNAIRYARGPIRVRLILDRCLICEVSDGSSTAPHLRRAAMMDEGGRGLFLVAQSATRWGTRYSTEGKVIWAELPIGAFERDRDAAA